MEFPPEPEPSRFSDRSSIASPPVRTSPLSAPNVQPAQSDNMQNQLNEPATSKTRQERDEVGNSERVAVASQMDLIRENQDIPARSIGTGTQRDDLEASRENVHNIPPIQIRSARSSLHIDDVVLTRIALRESSTSDVLSRDSQVRHQDVNIEGISSIRPVGRSITSGIRQTALDNSSSGPLYQHEGIHPP